MTNEPTSENEEVELDDDALSLAAGGIDPARLTFQPIAIQPIDTGKYPIGHSPITPTSGSQEIYSIQAINLVSNFSDHHLDYTGGSSGFGQ